MLILGFARSSGAVVEFKALHHRRCRNICGAVSAVSVAGSLRPLKSRFHSLAMNRESRDPEAVGVFISSEGAKKTDVAEHPEVFDHVGLLVNGLPGAAGLPFI
jgi:hypothetical protein